MDRKTSMFSNSDSIREIRSASLRLVALAVLFANLVLGDGRTSVVTHITIMLIYLMISIASIFSATYFAKNKWLTEIFVALDAGLVVIVLYEHILANPITENHNLTTSSLVVAFILLNHVALKLEQRLVLLFSGIVIIAWIAMLALMAYRHHSNEPGTLLANFFNQDLGLTISFAFTAFAVFLLARDHDRTRKAAMRIEDRRMNLSRFFSPMVVAELEVASSVLDLERRNAAVMFIDIRDFTSYSETATARELARVLAEYRRIVAGTVFAYGGTVDKFIGDGVIAVFGQPKSRSDDAHRALACAIELMARLECWKISNIELGGPSLETGIGLHYGSVISGVLESGYHDELTVIGDTVNVAQRLETLTKKLEAPLVVSITMMGQVPGAEAALNWVRKDEVALAGRRELIDIAYVRRAAPAARLQEAS